MLQKNYAKFYAIIYFWLRMPFSQELSNLWEFNEIVEKNSAQAACNVIRTYFEPFAYGLQIRFSTTRAQNYLDEVLNCMPLIPLKIIDAKKDNTAPLSTYGYNFLIVDGIREFNDMRLTRKTSDVIDIEQYFLISVLDFQNLPDSEQNYVQLISNYFWKNLFLEVKILFTLSPNVTNFYTYQPFTRGRQCKRPTVVHLNTMIGAAWLKPLLYNYAAKNLSNLQGCPLKVATWDSPPFLSLYPWKTGFEQFGDFEGRLIVELAQKFNFTLEVVQPENDELRGTIFKNGTTTGAIRMLQKGEADFSIGCFRYSLDRRQLLSSLLPYYQTSQVYGVSMKERHLPSTKILASAFDGTTWFCIFFSLQISMALTYFLYRRRKQNMLARNILGRPLSAACILNIIGVSLGVPINRLPATNFTRYIIALWYIYGIVIRTAYLSLLFKILQSDMYVKPPKSFKDLMTQHYKLVMIQNTYASTYALFRGGEQITKVILHNITDEATFDYMTQHSTEPLASVSPKEFLVYYMVKTKDAGRFSILPQSIFSHHVTMYLPKFSYLTQPFDNMVKYLRYNGLIDYWAKQSLDLSKSIGRKEKTFKALTVTQLLGVFEVYEILMLVSLIIFGLEWLVKRKTCRAGKDK